MVNFAQLRDRKLARTLLAYLAGAWVVLQVVIVISDSFAWSEFWVRALIVILAVGFFAVATVAWYHGEKGAQRVGVLEAAMLVGLLIVAGIGVVMVGRPGDDVAEASSDPVGAAAPSAADAASIAVLPFENLSSDPEQAYFSDGLTEELLNALAHIPGLRVSARTSSFAFRESDVTIDSIGRALKVAHLVEGSVRKAGDQIRVNAQLVDAVTGVRLWSASYDRSLMDVFAIQDEISRSIASELRIRVGGDAVAERGTSDSEAYALVLRGKRAYANGGTASEYTREAEGFFAEALARDSSYGEAMAGLAAVYAVQAYTGLLPRDSGYAVARRAGERALELDSSSSLAHSALGRIHDFYYRDYERAAEHYGRALELNPSDSRTRSLYAGVLMREGRQEEALREGGLAVELDPIAIPALNNFGEINRFAGRYDEAARLYRSALDINSAELIALGNLAVTQSLQGQHDQAVATARRLNELDPDDPYNRAVLAYATAGGGNRPEAEQILATVPAAAYFARAMAETALGNADNAFRLLNQAIDANDDYVGYSAIDPVFQPLHDDARFTSLVERLDRS